MLEIFAINLGDRQAMFAEVAGELKEGSVLLADTVENTDCADTLPGEPDDLAAGAAEFSLHGVHRFNGRVEVLLEQSIEDVHPGLASVQATQRYHWN
jgi:hypothetical protein